MSYSSLICYVLRIVRLLVFHITIKKKLIWFFALPPLSTLNFRAKEADSRNMTVPARAQELSVCRSCAPLNCGVLAQGPSVDWCLLSTSSSYLMLYEGRCQC